MIHSASNPSPCTSQRIQDKFPGFVVHLLTDGLERELRRAKQKAWRELSHERSRHGAEQRQFGASLSANLEHIMARIAMKHNLIRIRDVRDKEEAAGHMFDLTRALAEEPFKTCEDTELRFKRNVPKVRLLFSEVWL